MKNNYAVIMAGGIGSRFWPMSTEERPKQFLDVLGKGKTLIRMTADRLRKVVPENQIYVMTNAKYADLVQEQTGLHSSQILKEPMMKNTAPCIAYAAHKIYQLNPEANLIVAPSDHLIALEDEFVSIIETAIDTAVKNDAIVTLGIKPSRPDTGYGYIQFEGDAVLGEPKKVKRFTEKPDLENAKRFLDSGDFYWNSGIFIWSCETILGALKMYQPELNAHFTSELYNGDKEQEFVNSAFEACESISVDYAILEHANNVHVVLSDFGWSDLGTWGSLYTHLQQDQNGNALVGGTFDVHESTGNIVHLPSNKLAYLHGLNDCIVVESDKVLMVIQKENEQLIKEYSKMMKDPAKSGNIQLDGQSSISMSPSKRALVQGLSDYVIVEESDRLIIATKAFFEQINN
jgi:mannose-1-phosphate guanylyltransferase